MSILIPGFSERVFEFSFNAEYASRMKAVLAGAPHIPTQNEEKWLGYDVAFEVNQRGGAVHAVALQHKVSRFVSVLGPSNDHFWDATGGPYFAFRLDTDQYNVIHSIAAAKLPGIEFHYSAPLFASRADMDSHYLASTVEPNSIWIDVAAAGEIDDDALHTIIYRPDGSEAFRFSEQGKKIPTATTEQRQVQWESRRRAKLEDVPKIYMTALKVLRDYWPRRRGRVHEDSQAGATMPRRLPSEQDPTIANTASLLARYFGLSLLVEVPK